MWRYIEGVLSTTEIYKVVLTYKVVEYMSGILLEDKFTVESCDNSKFERVTRVKGRTTAFDAEVTLDINTSIYPVKVGDVLTFSFAAQRAGAGGPSVELKSLMDEHEYVMLGKIFSEEDKPPERRAVYISFGGLLCGVIADRAILSEFVLDKRVFILISKRT